MTSKKLSTIALLFVLIAPSFLSAGCISTLMFLVAVILLIDPFGRINMDFAPFVLPMIVFIVVGLYGLANNQFYDVFKDVWYVGKSIVALLVGHMLMQYIDDFKIFLKIIILAASISAIVHLSKFVFSPDMLSEHFIAIRQEIGRGYLVVALGLAVVFACRMAGLQVFKSKLWMTALAIVMTASFALSFSRTLLLSFVLLFAALLGWWGRFNKKMAVTLSVCVCVAIATQFFTSSGMHFGRGGQTFTEKVLYSLKEIAITDYRNPRDYNRGWRGYESYRGLKTYIGGNAFQYLVGRGFGALVDLGFYIRLGDERHRYIPVFHNGYVYALVKSGLLGLGLYIYFLSRIVLFGNGHFAAEMWDEQMAGRLLSGLGWVLLFTTIVVAGFFNKITVLPLTVTIGSCLAFLQKRSVNSSDSLPGTNET